QALTGLVVSFFTGIFTSHLYRRFIIHQNWLKFGFLKLIPRFIASSLVLAACYYVITFSLTSALIKGALVFPDASAIIADLLNLSFVYLVWSLIYFLFNFIENYKQEEIKNLRWEASKNEVELNRLKSQLNPHFMFNAMNSIRALIDENPAKAKDAITQLSNILRTTLQMGKLKLISFDEEMNLVQDYLSLEHTRYEERLKVHFDISPETSRFKIPPLMLQTIVENAIKHGISKLMEGGEIRIEAKVKGNLLVVNVINDGQLKKPEEETTGFGILNTIQRLNLLFGDKASFELRKLGEKKTLAELKIPKNDEGINN
ncbi:MAG: histidine kinase, partial [Bacteroidetes bacterium]|nr:histidine kinase [Bacteroidota bacterium]